MNELEQRVEDITIPIDVAVIGCIVNGPGEAKEAELGLTGGTPSNLVYVDGVPSHKFSNEGLVDSLEKLIRDKVAKKAIQMAEDEKNIIARA
jgi:(E)-4-hydroxy-3-methylbut-2-enyl-diphosphate synthase